MDEWVEVKASSVEDAVKAGMAELDIDNRDYVDIEVLQEPEKGFLGIGRQDAVVKIKPRPKPKRKRSRNRRGKTGESQTGGRDESRRKSGGQRQGGAGGKRTEERGEQRDGNERGGRPSRDRTESRGGSGGRGRGGNDGRGDRDRDSRRGSGERRPQQRPTAQRRTEAESVDINEQAQVIEEFLVGLLGAFGLEGTVETRVEDDVIYADINGEQTEALIGHKASILQAIHELAKTVVQRKTMAGTRLRLDVGGYAERRRQALTIYAGGLAEQVLEDNAEVVLEAMNPADRKTVHDAVSDIDGVRSFSEGEDPRRAVVLAPDK